ncbi:hypothetical protein [Burkholderia anthinoferrum]|uniref:hypothetical protein n=1 Tax=Burkholderia anthinoferrum TaxID=3090833 RepID=UPI0021564A2B|nr:hypothetical protein [Burkholderia anthinoferrum]
MKSMNAISFRVACLTAIVACATGFGHMTQKRPLTDTMTEVETDLVTPLEQISTDGRLACMIAGNNDSTHRRIAPNRSVPVVSRRQEPFHHFPGYKTTVDDAKDWT